jgi:uncharacterized spore protein YtfJ
VSWSVEQLLGQTRDALTVKRVFGEAYERNGVTVIPVASVRGTAGGGGGGDSEGNGGTGGGFGLSARPVGAFVVKGDDVSWRPAYDATRVALLGEVVAALAVLTLRSVLKRRAKRRR